MFNDQMIVLTYVIRDDADKRGYNPWLRTIDNPFFNSVPKIAEYENWRLAGPHRVPWTHFDLLHPAKGVAPEEVFQDPVVADFAANWSRLWGVDPAAEDQSANYQIHILQREQQGQKLRGELLALIIDPDMQKLPEGAEIWSTHNMVVGDNQLGRIFALLPLSLTNDSVDDSWGRCVLIGECIASPNGS